MRLAIRPGFRRTTARRGGARPGLDDGPIEGNPFSHAQILHLMKSEFARARRHGYPLACLLVEVDRLQPLAEVHGLEFREAIRRELGALIRSKTRGHDHLGLLRADRFLLVMPHTGTDDAMVVARRIRESFADLEVESHGAHVPLSLSMGASSSDDQEALFFDTVVSQAEVALGWAIQEGGDRAVLFRRERFVGELPAGEDEVAGAHATVAHESPAGRRREDDRRHAP